MVNQAETYSTRLKPALGFGPGSLCITFEKSTVTWSLLDDRSRKDVCICCLKGTFVSEPLVVWSTLRTQKQFGAVGFGFRVCCASTKLVRGRGRGVFRCFVPAKPSS